MASCFNSIGDLSWLSSVYRITGKMDGFIFSTVICVSGGRLFLICAILDSILCWLRSTLAFQSINADISQLPLLVVLRIIFKSGTCLITFSNGFVTVIIILFTGCKPASAMILILGKLISGKRAVCILLYTNNPAPIMRTSKTETGFLYD